MKSTINVDTGIYENYLQYISCTSIALNTCYPDNCSNPTIHFNCNIVISTISYSINGRNITFFIDGGDITGALLPLSYSWSYDTNEFTLIGNITSNTLVLTLDGNKEFDEIVTPIEVQVIDSNQCIASKVCYFVQNTMQCDINYTPCSNTSNLVVSNSSLPYFNIIANGLNSITGTSFRIDNSDTIYVNWGDGIIDTISAGTNYLIHTYSDPYTGYIKISSIDLSVITNLTISNDTDINPLDGALAVLTSELHKLTGLIYLKLDHNIFTDGIVSDLPNTLTTLILINTNLSGNVGSLPNNIVTVDIEGINTITGSIVNIPTSVLSFIVKGINTLSGNVNTLSSTIVFFSVYGNNTISGLVIDLPRSLNTVIIFGFNTITGDIAGMPDSCGLDIQGNNTIYGNVNNIPLSTPSLSLGGNTTVIGDVALLPTGLHFFEIGGVNTVHGDIALLPPDMYYFGVVSTNGIFTYTPGVRTWRSSMDSVIVDPSTVPMTSIMVDNILIELAAQVTSWFPLPGPLFVRLQGVNQPRTSASDAAVTTITGYGVTVQTN